MKHKHSVYLSIFLFTFFSILFQTYIPVIWPDEVLFFSPSYELGINGIMRTMVMEGLIPGMDTHTLWMPPAYIILLSGVFQIFPAELLTARLFSSFISIGSLLLVYKICLQFNFSFKRTLGVLILLATDFLFLKFSHTARMESLCLFFALSAFYFLLRSPRVTNRNTDDVPTTPTRLDIFLSGICLSLSFLSHPFGIVHSIPVLFLLYQRNAFTIKNLALYAVAGFLPIAAWGFYVIPNWDFFVVQFGAQLSRKNELLGKFSWVDKVKIIFSVYKFPMIKLGLFAITLSLFLFGLVKSRFKNQENVFAWIKKVPEVFFFVWLITILGFLFLSSESWYVFHMVVPFTLLLSSLIEVQSKPYNGFFVISLLYNILITSWILFSNYFIYKSPEKTNEFFGLIEKEVERKNNIYLQAIPDPYFYLRKKFPNKTLHEFIPGELSGMNAKNPDGSDKKSLLQSLGIAKKSYKIDSAFYKETIHKQEVFLFYNENLMNDYIRTYLAENPDKFDRKLIQIETPKGSDLKLEAVIFVKK